MRWISDYHLDWQLDWRGPSDDLTVFPGFGPAGAATFALDIENGYTLAMRWPTNVIKTASGKEQRISRNDRPKESYSGAAVLLGAKGRDVRAILARYAADGSAFLLALPHEQMLLQADASGTTVYVSATALALCDWKKPGQRAVVVREDDEGEFESVDVVIQSTTADSITLDVAPGSLGLAGGRIMPVRPVYLEPQQDFERIAVEAEMWRINCRAAIFDFAMTLHTLALGDLTDASGFDSASVTARTAGAAPSFEMVGDAIAGVSITESGSTVTIHFVPGGFDPSTVTEVYDALLTSTLVIPSGTWGTGIMSSDDEVAETALAGGDTQGPAGEGATLTEYRSRPVWDYDLSDTGTVTDSIHAMTEIIDFDGVPYAVGSADMADWGRSVTLRANTGEDFQWLKKLLAQIKGAQKGFWLPTWRADLDYESHVDDSLVISGGDFFTWWPRQRQDLHVIQADETITYTRVTAAVNNGDGTATLTLDATLSASPVTQIGWLEHVRFEGDSFRVVFDQHGMSL